ncbi:hypothetical protein DICA1_A06018 [Diutina catenulata]
MSKQITAQEAQTLVQGLKSELAQYQAAGGDREKAQEHFQKAERYKQLLLQYKQQQRPAAPPSSGPANDDPSITQAINSVPSRPSTPLTATTINQPSPNASLERKISQLKVTFNEVRARIDLLEESKKNETDQDKIDGFDRELTKLKPTFTRIANILSNQRISLSPQPERAAASPVPLRANSQSPPARASPTPTSARNPPLQPYRAPAPTQPAPQVRTPTAVTAMRPMPRAPPQQQFYGMRQSPMYPDFYPNYQPDASGRMLQKRKLQEVVTSMSVDEGEANVVRGAPLMDGDVEDLLVDLADEFVTQVTSFACRLAKHRKVELIDMKDVQLNLERNWGVRVPGYNLDEIKTTRKWQPSSEYQERQASVEQAKKDEKN